jgi:immunity protein, SdpI family
MITAYLALVLPVTAAVIWWVFQSLRPANGDAAHQTTHTRIALAVVIFVMALETLIVATVTGVEWLRPLAPRATVVLVGLFFIAVGNLLPRTRPNLAIGIRTTRLLADRRLWMQMHRVTGHVAVLFGVVVALAGLFAAGRTIGHIAGAAAIVATAVVAVSYKRQSRA